MIATRLKLVFWGSACLTGVLGCGAGPANQAQQPAVKPTYYAVEHYDESRDPAVDLAATVERAQREGKHILIQVGGKWCGFCTLMTRFMENNPAVRDVLERDYLVMKVNYSPEQENEAFLSDYPEITGYPHVFLLDSAGQLLHSQSTAELEGGPSYNEQRFIDLLSQWGPRR